MMLNGAGQLGLGSTSPLGMLEIQGGADTMGLNDPHALALAYHNGGFRHWISSRHNSAATGNAIDFHLNTSSSAGGSSAPGTGNVPILTLANQGVGIGTTTPAAKLDVAGNLNASGNATFNNMPGENHSQSDGGATFYQNITDVTVDSFTINIPASGSLFVSAFVHTEGPLNTHEDFKLFQGSSELVRTTSSATFSEHTLFWVIPVSAGPVSLHTTVWRNEDGFGNGGGNYYAHNLTAVYLPIRY